MEFNDWINQKYREFRGDAIGHDRTQKDFAEWIGVSNSLLTYWRKKNGKKPKQKKTIDKLIKRYGSEVYDVLKIPPPPEFILKLEDFYPTYDELSPDRQQQFIRRFSELISDYSDSKE